MTSSEAALVARLVVDPSELETVEWLSPDEFQTQRYAHLFRAMRQATSDGRVIDAPLFKDRLGEDISDLLVEHATAGHRAPISEYARQIRQMHVREWLLSQATLTPEALSNASERLSEADSPQGDLIVLADLPEPSSLGCLVGELPTEGQRTVIFGESQAGKSYLAAALGLSVASGREVIAGWRPNVTGPVLIVDYETNSVDWKRRLSALAQGTGLTSMPREILYRQPEEALPFASRDLARQVRKERVQLVIVDSQQMAMPPTRAGADASETVRELHAALNRLDTTVVVIAHVSKSNRREIYGSVFAGNIPDETWLLEATGAGAILTHVKARGRGKLPPIGLSVAFGRDATRYAVTGAANREKQPTKPAFLAAIVRDQGPLERSTARELFETAVGGAETDSNWQQIVTRAKNFGVQKDGTRLSVG